MKDIKKRAFTLVEMMVVIGLMAILLVLIVGNFSDQKKRSRDNLRISGMQNIRLALEEYKLTCGEYPKRLDPGVNNGRNNGTCPNGITFEHFLPHPPKNPKYAESPVYNDFYYRALSSASGGPCYEYYLAVALENKESKELKKDHDWQKKGSYTKTCRGAESGIEIHDDEEGWYDVMSQNSR